MRLYPLTWNNNVIGTIKVFAPIHIKTEKHEFLKGVTDTLLIQIMCTIVATMNQHQITTKAHLLNLMKRLYGDVADMIVVEKAIHILDAMCILYTKDEYVMRYHFVDVKQRTLSHVLIESFNSANQNEV